MYNTLQFHRYFSKQNSIMVISRSMIDYSFRFLVFFSQTSNYKKVLQEWYVVLTVYSLFIKRAFDGDLFNPKSLHISVFTKFRLLKPENSIYFIWNCMVQYTFIA